MKMCLEFFGIQTQSRGSYFTFEKKNEEKKRKMG